MKAHLACASLCVAEFKQLLPYSFFAPAWVFKNRAGHGDLARAEHAVGPHSPHSDCGRARVVLALRQLQHLIRLHEWCAHGSLFLCGFFFSFLFSFLFLLFSVSMPVLCHLSLEKGILDNYESNVDCGGDCPACTLLANVEPVLPLVNYTMAHRGSPQAYVTFERQYSVGENVRDAWSVGASGLLHTPRPAFFP
jgi:hypothetical protein